jgi:hypothetical protein
MSDETTHPDPQDDDFEAHGLKEGIAVALGVGALAVPGVGQAYVAPPGDGDGPVATAPASTLATQAPKRKAAKKKAAKKKATKTAPTSSGKTSPKKPLLEPDA